jgi:hypothetical protein
MEELSEKTWVAIMKLADLHGSNNQVNEYVLSNSENVVTKTIVYIYTMESFVYRELNKAARNYDLSKVDTLGPFAVLLTQIIYSCEEKRMRGDSIAQNYLIKK